MQSFYVLFSGAHRHDKLWYRQAQFGKVPDVLHYFQNHGVKVHQDLLGNTRDG